MIEVKDTNKYYAQGISYLLQKALPIIFKSHLKERRPKIVLSATNSPILNHYCLRNDNVPVLCFSIVDRASQIIQKSCTYECGVIYRQDTAEEVVNKIKSIVLLYLEDQNAFKRKFRDRCHLRKFTNQEIRVLHHIKCGLSQKEISSRLNINIKTVSSHKQNIMGKLSISRNATLVDWLRRGGLEYVEHGGNKK